MTPSELRKIIARLDPAGPIHSQLEIDLREGVGHGKAWYSSQKEHWLGWLEHYDGPGAYGRANWANRSAEFVYNHIQCAPMLVWLAEALGVPSELLKIACIAVTKSGSRHAAQCGAFRRAVTWADIRKRIELLPKVKVHVAFAPKRRAPIAKPLGRLNGKPMLKR